MFKLKVKSGRSCFFWHSWVLVNVSNITEYYKCKRCETKLCMQTGPGYQPIDNDWMFSKVKNKD